MVRYLVKKRGVAVPWVYAVRGNREILWVPNVKKATAFDLADAEKLSREFSKDSCVAVMEDCVREVKLAG